MGVTMKSLATAFRNSTLERQLSLAIASAVLLLAVLSSLASSWQGSREIHNTMRQHGIRIAERLAVQSRLALLTNSPENAADALAGALNFPDVMRVEIHRIDGSRLVAQGDSAASALIEQCIHEIHQPELASEDSAMWHFVAPVKTAGAQSPFMPEAVGREVLGHVHVIAAKNSLRRAVLGLVVVNSGIALLFGALFLLTVRSLTRRLTRPLAQLAATMRRSETEKPGIAADLAALSGPRDIAEMAHAFNRMIVALDQREQALKQQHAHLQEAQRIAGLGSWEYDFATRRVRCSDEVYRLLDVTPASFDPSLENFLALIPLAEHASVRAALEQTLQSGQGMVNHRVLRRDGQNREMVEHGELIRDANGRKQALIGTILDVTERRAAARALAQSEAQFRTLAQVVPVGIFRTAADGVCRYVNQHYCQMTGLDVDTALRAGWLQAAHAADRAQALDAWRKTIESGAPFAAELRFVRPTGEIGWILAQAHAEIDVAGKIIGFVGCITDLTQRKAAEEALRREAELIAAKKLAEDANLTKSRFLAAASHDLRQPIQAIDLFNEALSHTPLSDAQQHICRYLSLSIRSLGDLLNALLDISKLDAGMVAPTLEKIDAEALLRKLDAEFASIAANKSLRLALRIPRYKTILVSDANLLQSLLSNLIDNAIKYTEHGGILVGIRRRGARALIQVWDSGVGIAPQHRKEIFEEYFQVGNPERDRTKGLGLGLSIVKRLAKLLETEVSCRSHPGRGSVFEFSLALDEAAAHDYRDREAPSADVVGASGCGGRRIVVVEDETMVAKALELSLESLGMRVATFGSAEEALASEDIAAADVYISDFRLPGMDGAKFFDTLQQRSPHPIKAILLTGDVSTRRNESAQTARWVTLFKPIDLPKLLAAMEQQESMAMRQ